MPAMFFVTGALLEGSLERRGLRATLWPRLRRLLIPYWVYAACCWVAMLVDGWRPTVGDALRWAVPLVDPTGSDALPGLWIPLWYLRAYLWFLLASGVIRWVQQRLGVLFRDGGPRASGQGVAIADRPAPVGELRGLLTVAFESLDEIDGGPGDLMTRFHRGV